MATDFSWDYASYPGYEKYPHLFKPIQIGKLTIPNRIKYAATEDNLNGKDGLVTDAGVAYLRERAKGVAGGMCFMQGVYMDEKRQGQGYVGQAAAWDDKFIPGLKRLADAIHEEKAIAGCQLMHCGRVGSRVLPRPLTGPPTVADLSTRSSNVKSRHQTVPQGTR
jgi:2,4-dienoyl-CoA reductase (NADPH2)